MYYIARSVMCRLSRTPGEFFSVFPTIGKSRNNGQWKKSSDIKNKFGLRQAMRRNIINHINTN